MIVVTEAAFSIHDSAQPQKEILMNTKRLQIDNFMKVR